MHSITNLKENIFPDLRSRPNREGLKILTMAKVLVETFVKNIQVAAEVVILAKIQAERKGGGGHLVQAREDAHVASRVTSLDVWLELDHPLAYDERPVESLALALTYRPEKGRLQLPTTKGHNFTQPSLAIMFYNLSQKPAAFTSPFEHKYSVLRLLPIAFKWMVRFLNIGELSDSELKGRFIYAVTVALRELKVRRIPATLEGSRQKKNNYLTWLEIPGLDGCEELENLLQPQTRSLLTVEAQKSFRDSTAWDTCNVAFGDFAEYKDRTLAPETFDIECAGRKTIEADPVNLENYTWCLKHFSMNDPACHYLLCVGFVISKMCKRLKFMKDRVAPANLADLYDIGSAAVPNTLTAKVLNTPFTTLSAYDGKATKGHTLERPFLVMFTVYAMSYLFPDSPLRMALAKSPGAGGVWTSKHSKSRSSAGTTS